MKQTRNILCSIMVALGLMVAFAMPAQADPIPFFGEVTSSTCFSSPFCDPSTDPFGFGDGGSGLVFGSIEWDPSTLLFTSLNIQIGAVIFNAFPGFDFVQLQFFDGELVGIVANLFTGPLNFLFLDGAPENGFTATNFDWTVNGFFTLPPDSDPKSSVPEPGTLALLGIGLLGLAARRRRRTLKN